MLTQPKRMRNPSTQDPKSAKLMPSIAFRKFVISFGRFFGHRGCPLKGPNPTSLLPGAISLAEPVLVKEYGQFAFTLGPMNPLQRLMHGFWALKVWKRSSENSFIYHMLAFFDSYCPWWQECWYWWRIRKTRILASGSATTNLRVQTIRDNSPPVSEAIWKQSLYNRRP